jgi:hypothetical protein
MTARAARRAAIAPPRWRQRSAASRTAGGVAVAVAILSTMPIAYAADSCAGARRTVRVAASATGVTALGGVRDGMCSAGTDVVIASTSSTGAPAALASGTADLAATAGEAAEESSAAVTAPLSVSAVAVVYRVADTVSGEPVTNLSLDALDLAGLLTGHMTWADVLGAAAAPDASPHTWPSHVGVIAPDGASDTTAALTSWLAAVAPDVRAGDSFAGTATLVPEADVPAALTAAEPDTGYLAWVDARLLPATAGPAVAALRASAGGLPVTLSKTSVTRAATAPGSAAAYPLPIVTRAYAERGATTNLAVADVLGYAAAHPPAGGYVPLPQSLRTQLRDAATALRKPATTGAAAGPVVAGSATDTTSATAEREAVAQPGWALRALSLPPSDARRDPLPRLAAPGSGAGALPVLARAPASWPGVSRRPAGLALAPFAAALAAALLVGVIAQAVLRRRLRSVR